MSSQNTMIRLYCIFNARPRDAYMCQLTRPLFAPKLTVNRTLSEEIERNFDQYAIIFQAIKNELKIHLQNGVHFSRSQCVDSMIEMTWQFTEPCYWPIYPGTFLFQHRAGHYNDVIMSSNHQPHDCLLNRLFRRRLKKTSKLRVTGLCARNSPVTGEFPAQRASNVENISIWWRHHGMNIFSVHWLKKNKKQ